MSTLTEDNLSILTLTEKTITSKGLEQRGIGDVLEDLVIQNAKIYDNYIKPTGKKSTGDFSFSTRDFNVHVDIKTHNINSSISMPNLISIKKLIKEIFNTKDRLYYFIISYHQDSENIYITNTRIINIYNLNINELSIGALGFGQLQIKKLTEDSILTNSEISECDFKNQVIELYKEFIQKQTIKWDKVLLTLNKY